MLKRYFESYYDTSGRSDTDSILDDEQALIVAINAGDFKRVDSVYKLIDSDSIKILVPYDEKKFHEFMSEITNNTSMAPWEIRRWSKKVKHHLVEPIRPKDNNDIWNHIEPIQFKQDVRVTSSETDWFVALPSLTYDPVYGIATH